MSGPTVADLDAIIAENARLLGEEPTIAVRLLKDGRVRVYDITAGWRKRGYREYSSLSSAHDAALVSKDRAVRVARLRDAGWTTADAVREVVVMGRS